MKRLICGLIGHRLTAWDANYPEIGWLCLRCGDAAAWVPEPYGKRVD